MNHFPFLPAGSSKSSSRKLSTTTRPPKLRELHTSERFPQHCYGGQLVVIIDDRMIPLCSCTYPFTNYSDIGVWGPAWCNLKLATAVWITGFPLSADHDPWLQPSKCSVVHNAGWGVVRVVTTRLPFLSRRSTNWPWQSSARREPKLLQCGNPTINLINPQTHQKSVI